MLSYIDTCLKGGWRSEGLNEVKHLYQTIKYWLMSFQTNDRSKSNYLRGRPAWYALNCRLCSPQSLPENLVNKEHTSLCSLQKLWLSIQTHAKEEVLLSFRLC